MDFIDGELFPYRLIRKDASVIDIFSIADCMLSESMEFDSFDDIIGISSDDMEESRRSILDLTIVSKDFR
jgi:hypothetical protein